eukprot:TRINITY_DN4059_c0_g1_i1.p1 TRINITY_DN4059_c0_g1~~TRINITY_DN4059_c0_g1_i1.p1  ORF type:complete len:207 (-),score=61.69 TRINITY_DN4059_c0_g1_i1:57-620(-)
MAAALVDRAARAADDVVVTRLSHTRLDIVPQDPTRGAATVRITRCVDCEFTLNVACSRVVVDGCTACTLAVTGKVVAGVVELNRCDDFALTSGAPLGTVQVDGCAPPVRLTFATPALCGSVVWANTPSVSVRFEDSSEAGFTTGENSLPTGSPGCQYIVSKVNGVWSTDELVRIPGGFPAKMKDLDQ